MNKLTISIIILMLVFIGGIGAYFIFQKSFSPASPANVPTNTNSSFGTMIAYGINDATMGAPGMLDAISQKGWTEFKKDDSAYQNLLSNLKKLIQDRTTLVKETGFSLDRELVPYFTWNVIEPQKGQFDWELTDLYVQAASNAGVKISAVIQPFVSWDQKNTRLGKEALDFAYYDYKAGPPEDIDAYKNFLTKMVERYKDEVAIWEIGNEPESPGGGYQNNPEGYFDLIKITSEAIKKANPKAKVTNGGAMPIVGMRESDSFKAYWTKFFALGGGQYLDYFNVHYNIERSPDAKLDTIIFEKNLVAFNDLMDKNGGRKPLYLTEFGIYSGSSSSQSFDQPAQGQSPSGQNPGPQGTLNQNQGGQQFGPPPGQQQMNSPKFDDTYFTISSDGKNWQPGNLIVKEASVPDIIQLQKNVGNFKKGDLLIYFVDFSTVNKPTDVEALGLIVSTDGGKIWGQKTTVSIKNKSNKGAAVDPSVAQLSDGTLRLYFFGSEITSGDPAGATGPHKVYSAVSSDGINFSVEPGVRFQATQLTDPEIIFYNNRWFMYYSIGQASKLAVSTDGLNFKEQAISGGDIGGVPGALVINEGVRLFGCGKGLATAVASDGINFIKEQEYIFGGKIQGIVCDPSVIKLTDGNYSLVYKIRQPQSSIPQGGPQTENQQPAEQQRGTLPAQTQESQATLYFKYSILAFANGANVVFIDMIGGDNDLIGSSMIFNYKGQPRLFLTTLKTIASKIGDFSKVEKIAADQYKFTVGSKTVYALWSETLPNEISGNVKVTDIKGQERLMDATGIKLKADQPVIIEL